MTYGKFYSFKKTLNLYPACEPMSSNKTLLSINKQLFLSFLNFASFKSLDASSFLRKRTRNIQFTFPTFVAVVTHKPTEKLFKGTI